MSAVSKLLVLSDDTPECSVAALFAAHRARACGGALVMLRCARSPGLAGWIGLDDAMRSDARDLAMIKVRRAADAVEQKVGLVAEVVVSDDDPPDALKKQIDEDPQISLLVLASGDGRRGPGPLVSRIGRGGSLSERAIPVLIVPGRLNDRQIEALASRSF